MFARIATALAVLISLSLPAVANQFQQPQRPAPTTGTARVSGTVTTAERPAQPLARADVTLTGATPDTARRARTDDQGRFVFDRVPAGRHTLTASRAGFVNGSFGAARAGGEGIAIFVTDGRDLADLDIELFRAASMSGVVRDRQSGPLSGVEVTLLRNGFDRGRRAPVSVGRPVTTDARGAYRFHSLPPGDYLVSVAPVTTRVGDQVFEQTTADDLERARRILSGAPADTSGPRRKAAVDYPQTFHPGTPSLADATPVRLVAGADRTGVDITVAPLPTSSLSGIVQDPAGGSLRNLRMWLRGGDRSASDGGPSATAKPDGTFAVASLFPGRYVLHARASLGAPIGTARDRPTHWARLEVTAAGADLSGLILSLAPMLSVEGRVEFETDEPAKAPLVTGLTVGLMEAGETVFYETPFATTGPGGAFVISGVAPARYQIAATPPQGWTLKSATAAGSLDLLDALVDIRPDQPVPLIVITYTQKTTELAGTLVNAAGQPSSEHTVVVFSAERAYWTSSSRRIRASRPAADGSFTFSNLPAGEYLMAAVSAVEDGQWLDPAFLEALVSAAFKVRMPDAGKVVQNLKIAK